MIFKPSSTGTSSVAHSTQQMRTPHVVKPRPSRPLKLAMDWEAIDSCPPPPMFNGRIRPYRIQNFDGLYDDEDVIEANRRLRLTCEEFVKNMAKAEAVKEEESEAVKESDATCVCTNV
jgi:hypothetical protein